MAELIQTYLPNVYKLGWSGQYGWGTAIYLTLYMTVISFIIGGFLGLVTGLLLVLTRPGGVIENRIVFQILANRERMPNLHCLQKLEYQFLYVGSLLPIILLLGRR